MKTYSLIGVNPAKISHKGVINGKKPTIGAAETLATAEPTVTAGHAKFEELTNGGLFAFDRKTVVIEALVGTFKIVNAEDEEADFTPAPKDGVAAPTTFPFTLLPNQWLRATSGSEVSVTARLAGQRIY